MLKLPYFDTQRVPPHELTKNVKNELDVIYILIGVETLIKKYFSSLSLLVSVYSSGRNVTLGAEPRITHSLSAKLQDFEQKAFLNHSSTNIILYLHKLFENRHIQRLAP